MKEGPDSRLPRATRKTAALDARHAWAGWEPRGRGGGRVATAARLFARTQPGRTLQAPDSCFGRSLEIGRSVEFALRERRTHLCHILCATRESRSAPIYKRKCVSRRTARRDARRGHPACATSYVCRPPHHTTMAPVRYRSTRGDVEGASFEEVSISAVARTTPRPRPRRGGSCPHQIRTLGNATCSMRDGTPLGHPPCRQLHRPGRGQHE